MNESDPTDGCINAEMRALFQQCFAASPPEHARFIDLILSRASPEQLVDAALAEFAERGNGERLSLAAAILARYGARALPPLLRLGRTSTPQAEYFIDTLMALVEAPELRRATEAVILEWRRHPIQDVRIRLAEVSELFDGESK